MDSMKSDFLISTMVTDLFSVESQICATRTSDLFKAYDKDRGKSVSLWTYRHQFQNSDPILKDFVQRLGIISGSNLKIPKLFSLGLDPSGVLFSVLESFDGQLILSGNIDLKEAERRWTQAVQIISELHSRSVICGDLCENSFVVDRSGSLTFIGIMGDLLSEDDLLPPGDTAAFVPSDQAHNISKQSHDVYALGVLGVKLYRKALGVEHIGQVTNDDLLALTINLPRWITDPIQKAASSIPNRRYNTAIELLESVRDIKEKILTEESQIQKSQTSTPAERNKDIGVTLITGDNKDSKENQDTQGNGKRIRIFIIAFILISLFIVFGFLLIAISNKQKSATPDSMEVLKEAADGKMRQAINVIDNDDSALNDKKIKFAELEQSDDPLAHGLLVEGAIKAKNPRERILAEHAIIARAKRMSLFYSTAVLSDWLESTSISQLPPEYSLALQAMDGTMPKQIRAQLAERIFSSNKELAEKLLTAFVLEDVESGGKGEELRSSAEVIYYNIFSMMIPKNISVLAVASLMPVSYSSFIPQLEAQLSKLSTADIKWIVLQRLKNNQPLDRSLAKVGIESEVFGTEKQPFAKVLLLDEGVPDGMLATIGDILQDKTTRGDVEQIGIWLHESSIVLLKSLLILDYSDDIISEAFDYLSGRDSSNYFTKIFLRWLKNKERKDTVPYIKIYGLAVSQINLSDEKLSALTEPLNVLDSDNEIFGILLQSENQSFLTYYLNHFASKIPGKGMISLLANPDPSIRILAIKGIKNENNTALLQLILEAYKGEQDPIVKEEYRKNIWVVRGRG